MLEEIKAAWSVYCTALQRWWDLAVEMMLLNIVVILASCTVVLLPLAWFGMWYCVSVMVHGEDYGIGRTFTLVYEGAKKYWKSALKWFALNIVVAGVLWVNISYYGGLDVFWAPVLRGFFIAVLALWGMVQMYTIPYIFEQYSPRLRVALKNGLFTLLAAPVFSVAVCGGSIVLLALFAGLFVPTFLGGLPLLGFLWSAAVLNRIGKYKLRPGQISEG